MSDRIDTEWHAPRRLTQLRVDLHDRVKALMAADYSKLFGNVHFAKYGAPPGTTGRPTAWLDKLADLINNGKATPIIAALTLAFLQAPLPEGALQPFSSDLRNYGDNYSNMGG